MIVWQGLMGAIDELIVAVSTLKKAYPSLSDERAIEIALELKRLGQVREVGMPVPVYTKGDGKLSKQDSDYLDELMKAKNR